MEVQSAIDLVHHLVTKPGWKLSAADTDRFEATIVLQVEYPAFNYNRENAPDYILPLEASASFFIPVADCDDVGLYHKVLHILVNRIENHEHREALRVAPNYWAPFHPHRTDGIKRYGDPVSDYLFGIV